MNCKLTTNVESAACDYEVAGARALFAANWYEAVEVKTAEEVKSSDGNIVYHVGEDGYIDAMALPTGEKVYSFDASDGTLNFTDTLTVGGNGAKYRTHTVNAMNPTASIEVKKAADPLSLGKFVMFIVDNDDNIHCLGRKNGLTASQFDYASGSAPGDAKGWTGAWSGLSKETAPLVKGLGIITALVDKTVVLA